MSEEIILSIIVPIYNVADYLEQCILSICEMEYSNLEIILVNDGSTDESFSICEAYQAHNSRIRVIHKENGGLVSARKAGAASARGKYIAFVDGDDWINGKSFDKILSEYTEKLMPDIIAFDCVEEYPDFQKRIVNAIQEGLYQGTALTDLKEKILCCDSFFEWRILPHLCDKFIKRDLLIKHLEKVPDYVTFGEDAASSFPCMMEASSIYISKEAPYHYRQREGSIVKTKAELSQKNFTAIYTLLAEAFTDNAPLMMQLKKYIFFLLFLKSYSRIANIMPLTPYCKVQKGDRVFVYGAGGFGNVIEEYIETSDEVRLAGWTDKRAEFLRKTNTRLNTFDTLFSTEYDHIVIAILNEKAAQAIRKELVQKGIPEAKIDWVKSSVIEELELPDWLGTNI